MSANMRCDMNGRGFARKTWLLAGASCAALAVICSLPAPASAANYTAANEAELQTRVAQANADGDPSSTITLTASFALTDPAASLGTAAKPLVIDQAGFNLSVTPASGTVTFGGTITGSGTFRINGPGTTILTGNNTYTGATLIASGTLALAAGGQVAATSTTTVQGTSTLAITGAGTRWQTGTLTLGTLGNSGTATLNVSDGGALVVTGALNQDNATGPTTVINVTGGGQITTGAHNVGASQPVAQDSTVLVSGAGSAWTTGAVVFRTGSLSVLDGGSYSTALATIGQSGTTLLTVSGAGSSFSSTGTGVFRVGAGNGATAIVTVADGGRLVSNSALTLGTSASATAVLNIGGTEGGPATGAGMVQAPSIAFGPGTGRINFNHTDAGYVFAPVITGVGTVNQTGPGTTILTADNTYTGTTTVSAGTLQLGNGGTSGSVVTDITNNGTLAFNRSDTLTYAGIVSGSGSVQQSGSGTLILTGVNTYTGGTTINAGTLAVAADSALGAATGALIFNGGRLRFDAGVTLAGSRAVGITAAGGTIDTNGLTSTIAGSISGAGALAVTGGGTLILTGENNHTGGTSIASATTLSIGNGGASGSIAGNVVNDGTLIVNRSGSVTLAGAISGSGALIVTGGGTVILTGENSYTGGTTITEATLQIGNGGTTGSILGNVLNNSLHSLVFNRSDTLTFAGVISGIGAVRQDGTGVTVLSGANTYSGTTTVNAGTLRAGAANAFSAASAVTVAAAATLDLAGFDQTVAGLTNAGLVTLGGAPGTRLTVAGNYVGQGGILALNTVLGGDGSASDRLVIQGGTATGDTRIRVANLGGSGAQTVEGIRVVQVTNGGSTASGAFRLDGRAVAGAFEYQLFRGGNTSADDWYLRSFITDTPVSPETPALPGSPGTPLYRPEVPLYAPVAALGRQMGLATLATVGSLHERVGEEENIRDLAGGSPYANGAWARAFGERARSRWDGPAASRATGNLIGLQAGFDILRTQPYADGHRDHAGVYVAYTDYNAPSVSGFAIGQQQRVGRLLMSGPAVGAYWTHFGPSGWYVDAVFQANWFDVTARSDFGAGISTNGTGYAASLEAGYPIRFGQGGRWQIEPQAQVIWQSVSIDRTRDQFSSVDWDEDDAVTGRIGARLQYTGRDERTLWQPYAKVNLWHSFSGSDRIRFGSSAPIENSFGETALEVGAGITARVNENTSLYAHADYRWSLDGDSRQTATQGSIGIRLNW